jgi:predicted ester cyclase
MRFFNQGKYRVASEMYAHDFVNHGFSTNIGLKEDQEAARGWREAIADIKVTVNMMVAEGDLVTALWSAEGTNIGQGNGLSATGKKVQSRGITIWRIVDGKIREEWSEFDRLRLMQQLGLIPSEHRTESASRTTRRGLRRRRGGFCRI